MTLGIRQVLDPRARSLYAQGNPDGSPAHNPSLRMTLLSWFDSFNFLLLRDGNRLPPTLVVPGSVGGERVALPIADHSSNACSLYPPPAAVARVAHPSPAVRLTHADNTWLVAARKDR